MKLQAANDCTIRRKRNFCSLFRTKEKTCLATGFPYPKISRKQFMSVEQDVLQKTFMSVVQIKIIVNKTIKSKAI
jgi:hypothetical protein